MEDATVREVSKDVAEWGGAAASGLSAAAESIVGHLNGTLEGQTAARQAFIDTIGGHIQNLVAKSQFAMEASGATAEIRAVNAGLIADLGRQANILSDVRYDLVTRLQNFTADMQAKINNPALGSLAKIAGPLIDAVQLVNAVIEDGVGSDSVAEVSTGIAAAEMGGAIGAFLVTAGAVGVGLAMSPAVAVAIGVGAFAGAFAGSAAGAKIYQNLIKPAAEAIPPELWDKYFDYGGKVADAIPTGFWDALFGTPGKISDWVNKKFRKAKKNSSPIIVDLDGDGIEIAQLTGGSILFDHDGDGIRTGTAWADDDDGMLVFDRNANGSIDTGRELFGDNTMLSDGTMAVDGYAAMRDLDSDADGQLTGSDTAFGLLRVWRDLNQDGISSPEELFTLGELGITQIGLTKTTEVSYLPDGTRLDGIGHLTMNGQTRTFTDAWYADNPFYSDFSTPVVVSEEALDLPDIMGSGALRSLREAATESATLRNLLVQFQQAQTSDAQWALVDQILVAWAETSPLTTITEWAAAGNPVSYQFSFAADPGVWPLRLSVLEAFNGESFLPLWTTAHAPVSAGPGRQEDLEEAYRALAESVYGALARQTRLKPYLDAIESTVVDGVLNFSATPVQAMLRQKQLVDERGATQDLADLLRFASPVLLAAGFDPAAELKAWLLAMPAASSLRTEILASLALYSEMRIEGTSADNLLEGPFTIDGHFTNNDLQGFAGNDTLVGGFGNDTMTGGDGADTYRVDQFGGRDLIDNADADPVGVNADVLELNMLRSDVTLKRSGTDLRIAAVSGPHEVVVRNYFQNDAVSPSAIEQIRFRDGQTLDVAQVKGQVLIATEGNDAITGYATNDALGGAGGNDVLAGTGGNDTLDGGVGNDTLTGGTGSDTYLFGLGSGRDVIDNVSADAAGTQPDTLQFGAGILAPDLKLTRLGADLILTIASTGEAVTVAGYFAADATTKSAVDVVRFWNGSVLTQAQIKAAVLVPSTGSDYLAGYGSTADSLSGGLGDDTLVGAGGNDTLVGGAGADSLVGGSGSDTFIFDLGGSADTIVSDGDAGSVDTLSLGSGISLANLNATRIGDDLILAVTATSDKVVVKNYFTPAGVSDQAIDIVRFFGGSTLDATAIKALVTTATTGSDYIVGYDAADSLSGGAGNDTLLGNAGNDTLEGGAGGDLLYGGQGSDTYRFQLGSGSDLIINRDGLGGPSTDTLELGAGISSANITVTNYGESLRIAVNGTSDQVTIDQYFQDDGLGPDGLGTIRFADSSTLSLTTIKGLVLTSTSGDDYLSGFATNDSISGAGGNDILTGKGGNDTLDGGAGDDLLTGNSGNNVFRFGRGDGRDTINGADSGPPNRLNTIEFKAGVLPSDVVISRQTSSLVLSIAGTSDVVTVWSFFRDDDPSNPYNPVQQVTFGDGTTWSAAAILAQWNPTSAGPDNVIGTYGADVILGGVGADTITGAAGADTVFGGTDADSLTGGDGNDSLLGEGGEDRLFGGAGDDTLDGGAGNDTLDGGLGDDQFNVGNNTGRDSISDSGGADKLVFGAGIVQADVTLFRDAMDLVVAVSSTAAQTRIVGYFGANGGIERMEFSDGDFWTSSVIASRIVSGSPNAATGTIGNDVFVVDNAGDTITEGAGQGTDLVNSSVGFVLGTNLENLTLTGYVDIAGTGNTLSNVITGNAGDNRLNGGLGLDTLAGGAGNDTYVVDDPDNAGAFDTPSDTIVENAGGGIDRVVIVGGAEYNYTLASNVEELYVTNVTSGWTTAGGAYIYRTLTGNALSNTIDFDPNSTFGATIDGGAGADTMRGSISTDIYVVDDPGDVIEELRGGALTSPYSAQDWVWSSISYTLGPWLENLRLTGNLATTGVGNELNNTLDGSYNSAGNVLAGGTGRDLYVLGAGDTVVEAASEGVDTVEFNYAPVDGILRIADTGAASIEFYRVAQSLGGGLTLVGTNRDETCFTPAPRSTAGAPSSAAERSRAAAATTP